MWQAFFSNFLRSNLPFIVFPVAVVLGTIGYNIEKTVVKQKTPYIEKSINEIRQERLLREMENSNSSNETSTKKRLTIFDMNKSSQISAELSNLNDLVNRSTK
jgi:hypothetical protein